MALTPRTVGLVTLLMLTAFTPPVTTASPVSIQAATPTTVSLVAGEEVLVAVLVLDADGNAVSEPDVQWQAPAVGPRAVMLGPNNQEDGYSTVAVHSAGGLGAYQITASIAGLPSVTFFMTNVVGPVNQLELVGGGTQSTAVSTGFAEPLRIRALDVDRNPLASVTITLQPAAVGPSATLSALTPQTDATGQVSVTAFANALGGAHVIQASAPKPGGGVVLTQIRLSNLVLVPGSVTLVGGDSQEAPLETQFARPLEVRIGTSGGVAIANVAVEFAGPLAGAGLGAAHRRPWRSGAHSWRRPGVHRYQWRRAAHRVRQCRTRILRGHGARRRTRSRIRLLADQQRSRAHGNSGQRHLRRRGREGTTRTAIHELGVSRRGRDGRWCARHRGDPGTATHGTVCRSGSAVTRSRTPTDGRARRARPMRFLAPTR